MCRLLAYRTATYYFHSCDILLPLPCPWKKLTQINEMLHSYILNTLIMLHCHRQYITYLLYHIWTGWLQNDTLLWLAVMYSYLLTVMSWIPCVFTLGCMYADISMILLLISHSLHQLHHRYIPPPAYRSTCICMFSYLIYSYAPFCTMISFRIAVENLIVYYG